jgi:SagB-type dehydrogenase family enzyme
MKRQIVFTFLIFAFIGISAQTIILPPAQKSGGMPLMDALSKRSTARAFDTTSLSLQQISDLLWSAFGINRLDGKRTAPSARNFQETDIYVLLKKGAYTYDAKNNQLIQVLNSDIRNLGGTQDFVKDAPVTLIFISNLSKMGEGKAEDKLSTASIDVGYISQNVYLYCASAGLVTGARGSVDKNALGSKLSLRTDQQIILGQSVGFPITDKK